MFQTSIAMRQAPRARSLPPDNRRQTPGASKQPLDDRNQLSGARKQLPGVRSLTPDDLRQAPFVLRLAQRLLRKEQHALRQEQCVLRQPQIAIRQTLNVQSLAIHATGLTQDVGRGSVCKKPVILSGAAPRCEVEEPLTICGRRRCGASCAPGLRTASARRMPEVLRLRSLPLSLPLSRRELRSE